ncbi:hypothetical protein BH23BAC1_BH23BAC1_22510 [soil metagenome]
MKNNLFIIIFSILIITSLATNAQTERGSKLLGGGASLQFSDPFSIGITPNMGFFLKDNFALGASLGFYYQTNNNYSYSNASLSPFARYYFGQGITRAFIKGSLGYGRNWQKGNDNITDFKTSAGYTIGNAGLGITRFITQQVGIEASLDYSAFFREVYHGRVFLSFGFQVYLPSSRPN